MKADDVGKPVSDAAEGNMEGGGEGDRGKSTKFRHRPRGCDEGDSECTRKVSEDLIASADPGACVSYLLSPSKFTGWNEMESRPFVDSVDEGRAFRDGFVLAFWLELERKDGEKVGPVVELGWCRVAGEANKADDDVGREGKGGEKIGPLVELGRCGVADEANEADDDVEREGKDSEKIGPLVELGRCGVASEANEADDNAEREGNDGEKIGPLVEFGRCGVAGEANEADDDAEREGKDGEKIGPVVELGRRGVAGEANEADGDGVFRELKREVLVGVAYGVLVGTVRAALVGVDRFTDTERGRAFVVVEALFVERFSMFLRTIDFRF